MHKTMDVSGISVLLSFTAVIAASFTVIAILFNMDYVVITMTIVVAAASFIGRVSREPESFLKLFLRFLNMIFRGKREFKLTHHGTNVPLG